MSDLRAPPAPLLPPAGASGAAGPPPLTPLPPPRSNAASVNAARTNPILRPRRPRGTAPAPLHPAWHERRLCRPPWPDPPGHQPAARSPTLFAQACQLPPGPPWLCLVAWQGCHKEMHRGARAWGEGRGALPSRQCSPSALAPLVRPSKLRRRGHAVRGFQARFPWPQAGQGRATAGCVSAPACSVAMAGGLWAPDRRRPHWALMGTPHLPSCSESLYRAHFSGSALPIAPSPIARPPCCWGAHPAPCAFW